VTGLSAGDLERLKTIAARIRRKSLVLIFNRGSGHPGGSLSCADILAVLYGGYMYVDPARPDMRGRDHFVLCKGHASMALYAALSEAGFLPDDITSLPPDHQYLQGHPDRWKTPGVEMSTGSLGQGLSVALGMALAARLDGCGGRVFALLGDGELDEGQVWEAAMAAANYRVDNLVAIVDRNGLQIMGRTGEVMETEPLSAKWSAFGWNVVEVDGNDPGAVWEALDLARSVTGRPSVLLAKTVKGKGVSFMEGRPEWHAKAISASELERALAELESREKGGGCE
jgi:transketolase